MLHGLGVVLSHVIDNEVYPVVFASRSLTSAEQNYAQIECEGLSTVSSVGH